MAFDFFTDAALSAPITSNSRLKLVAGKDGSSGNVDRVIYFGSPDIGRTIVAASDPGVDNITISVEDADANSGQPNTALKLALSANGLAAGGPTISLGVTELTSGVANAVPIYIRFNVNQANNVLGLFLDLSLTPGNIAEY
jgi:hypothetical protein